MENFASPSSPKKLPASIAEPLICWNCLSFRVKKVNDLVYPFRCSSCEARGCREDFIGNPESAAIVNRRRSA